MWVNREGGVGCGARSLPTLRSAATGVLHQQTHNGTVGSLEWALAREVWDSALKVLFCFRAESRGNLRTFGFALSLKPF